MQAAESHCWCNSSASRNKINGGNGGTADGMAESNGRRNGRMTGMAGMAEMTTYVLFTVHTDNDDDDDDDDDDDFNLL